MKIIVFQKKLFYFKENILNVNIPKETFPFEVCISWRNSVIISFFKCAESDLEFLELICKYIVKMN